MDASGTPQPSGPRRAAAGLSIALRPSWDMRVQTLEP